MNKKKQANPYFILNVSPQAKTEEIKKAYLKLVQVYHPDRNRGNKLAEKKFQKINSAWQILKEPKKRQLFDKSLKPAQTKDFIQSSKNSARSSGQKVIQEKAIDLEYPLKVSLEDVCQFRARTIHYLQPVNGSKVKNLLKVQIPIGAKQNSRLRFKEKGGAEGKKIFGDLYVRILIAPHPVFKLIRESMDIILERPISFVSAIQGDCIDVPSPHGLLSLELTPPVQHKQLLKIKEQGLFKNSEGKKGDLFVRIVIDYPLKNGDKIQKQIKNMTYSQKKIYVEKFKNPSFIYPKVLKFEKKLQQLQKKRKRAT